VQGLSACFERRSRYDIECIFDQGCEGWGRLVKRLKADFGIDATPRNKKKIKPLQAADWLAYEGFREILEIHKRPQRRKMRGSYILLLRVPFDPIVFHEKEIREAICIVPGMKVPERSSQGKGLVRLKYDWRQMDRTQRRYKRLRKKLAQVVGVDVSALHTENDVSDDFISSNPRVSAIQGEIQTANAMRDAQNEIATALLSRMRIDSQEDQEPLRRECSDALRSQRE
jgi:hypothetical protein